MDELKKFVIVDGKLQKYNGNEDAKITIPDGVEIIEEEAFEWCKNLVSVVIPGSVREIAANAFGFCENLENVTLSEGLLSIGDYAFTNCKKLVSIAIPKSVASIGERVFDNCEELTSISVSVGNSQYVGIDNCLIDKTLNKLLYGCKKSVIPNGGVVKTIGKAAFCGCKNLTTITIPDGIEIIEEGAFEWCKNIASVVIPGSVREIAANAFGFCENLENVTLSEGLLSIGDYAFTNCKKLVSIAIPKSVASIGKETFDKNVKLGYDILVSKSISSKKKNNNVNFEQTVKNEIKPVYRDMLDRKTSSPFISEVEMVPFETYKNKRNNYCQRLEAERSSFNRAISETKWCGEKNDENRDIKVKKRAYKGFKCRQVIKTIIFFLPLVLLGLIGWDIFDSTHGLLDKIQGFTGLAVGYVIAGFVIISIIALLVSILSTVKMFRNEHYEDGHYFLGEKYSKGYTITGTKPYTTRAIMIFVLCMVLIVTNLMPLIININKNKITYVGGDVRSIEYVDKDKSVILPEANKRDKEFDDYLIRYTFEGWMIDGQVYAKGSEYKPNGWKKAIAKFSETEWVVLNVYASNAKITVSCNGQELSEKEKYEFPRGTQVTVTASFSYSDTSFRVGGISVSSPYTFTVEKNTSVSASSSDPGCLVEGTSITLADGKTKAIEDLKMGDMLLVFNHETGRYENATLLCNIHANIDADYYDIINLYFSDGTLLRIVDEHGLFDKDLNKYVYINEKNANDFIGHNFVSLIHQNGENSSKVVALDRVEFTHEYTRIYNPASVWHINLIANNMLTLSAGMVNLFEYDEDMKYDEFLMSQDIEKYGLYTYDDFKEYVSLEVFNIFPFKYYKVAVGKGMYSYEQVLGLIQLYNDAGSVK